MGVKVSSFLENNMLFRYEDRLKVIYLDEKLQIESGVEPEEACVYGMICDESYDKYVKLKMDGGYELTDEVRALCELAPGDNYFIMRYDIGNKYKNNDVYTWYLTSLGIPCITNEMKQYFNSDYAMSVDFELNK